MKAAAVQPTRPIQAEWRATWHIAEEGISPGRSIGGMGCYASAIAAWVAFPSNPRPSPVPANTVQRTPGQTKIKKQQNCHTSVAPRPKRLTLSPRAGGEGRSGLRWGMPGTQPRVAHEQRAEQALLGPGVVEHPPREMWTFSGIPGKTRTDESFRDTARPRWSKADGHGTYLQHSAPLLTAR